MKDHIKYLCGLCLLCVLCTACQDGDWDVPDFSDGAPYGNNAITETNVISIAQLKSMYPDYNKSFSCLEITDDVQLKVRVTGNDLSGNIYNSIAVQDEQGNGLIIGIAASDLYAMMPVGQELLINLKGLYFGCYGFQPQVGTPYTNNAGNTFPSRMNHSIWKEHVKLMGKADPSKVVCIDFPDNPTADDAGKLMTIKNVSIKDADGTTTWAPKGGNNSVERYFADQPYENSSKFCIYTSTYADFANTPIPKGKMNLTGIWKVYQSKDKGEPKWELVLRDAKDIKSADGNTPDNGDNGQQTQDPTGEDNNQGSIPGQI